MNSLIAIGRIIAFSVRSDFIFRFNSKRKAWDFSDYRWRHNIHKSLHILKFPPSCQLLDLCRRSSPENSLFRAISLKSLDPLCRPGPNCFWHLCTNIYCFPFISVFESDCSRRLSFPNLPQLHILQHSLDIPTPPTFGLAFQVRYGSKNIRKHSYVHLWMDCPIGGAMLQRGSVRLFNGMHDRKWSDEWL